MNPKIPKKYLNNNVQAMLSGGQETAIKQYTLHLDKIISFFRNKYRVEIKISKEDTEEKKQ